MTAGDPVPRRRHGKRTGSACYLWGVAPNKTLKHKSKFAWQWVVAKAGRRIALTSPALAILLCAALAFGALVAKHFEYVPRDSHIVRSLFPGLVKNVVTIRMVLQGLMLLGSFMFLSRTLQICYPKIYGEGFHRK